MRQEELHELSQRINHLTQLLTYMSMQLSAAMKVGMTALPAVQKEFAAIQEMAAQLGIAGAGKNAPSPCPAGAGRANATAEYLDSIRALEEMRLREGKKPNEYATGV